MKLVTWSDGIGQRAGLLINDGSATGVDRVVDVAAAYDAMKRADSALCGLGYMPSNILDILRLEESGMNDLRALHAWCEPILSGRETRMPWEAPSHATLVAPVPHPTSMRDGYAFRQHVESARRNRGLEMIPEFDEIPIFYFTNHQAVFGPGDVPVMPLHCDQLDFELECCIVIGKKGANIPASEADAYIAGYMVMNDWSARGLQMQEMKLNLGPAKGKDFATSIGPWLVTADEFEQRRIETPDGDKYNLAMRTTVNGTEVSTGNVRDMTWTFAQIIERASYGVTLFPGDVIGSGTCGTGCFLELNGSKVYDPAWWLKPGDVVVCEVEGLGSLTNTLVAAS